jgi:hypothetical protein
LEIIFLSRKAIRVTGPLMLIEESDSFSLAPTLSDLTRDHPHLTPAGGLIIPHDHTHLCLSISLHEVLLVDILPLAHIYSICLILTPHWLKKLL